MAVFALLAVLVGIAERATAGVALKVTVNSTANTDDGDCTGFPNAGAGNCTFHEAIHAANDGLADVINFHPAVFSKQSPGVIFLDEDEGCLPTITREITIDVTGAGVTLDGDRNNDLSAESCDAVILVEAQANGWDFTLIGAKNLVMREFDCCTDGVELDGLSRSFGDVLISGIIYQDGDIDGADDYDSEDGIDFNDADNLINIVLTNNDFTVDDDGYDVDTNDDEDLVNSRIEITESRVVADFDSSGSGEGADVDMDGDLASKVTVLIHDNESLTSFGNDGVDLDYCDDVGGCDGGAGAINFQVNDNGKIHGGFDSEGVEIDVRATTGGITSGAVTVDVQVNGNGLIDADDAEAVDINVEVCCDESDSVSTVTVSGNDDMVGDDEGVEIDVDLGCGDDNVSTIAVVENASIEGQNDEGVEIDAEVGQVADGCPSSLAGAAGEASGTPAISEGNDSTIQVNDNERITGGDGDQGVEIDANTGSEVGTGDDNTTTVQVNRNGEIQGEDEGVEIDADAGSESGPEADDNTTIIEVKDNADIHGDDDEGVDIGDSDAGVDDAIGDIPTFPGDSDADGNTLILTISGNGVIDSGDDDGIEVDVEVGGNTEGSGDNAGIVSITDNGEIEGRVDSGGDGIDVDMEVCCDSANTNTLTIADNDSVLSRNDDGIDIDLCCSVNLVTIDSNGEIRGNDGDGIDFDVDNISDGDSDFTEPCPQDCGVWSSVTQLVITNNDIFNSEDDGIEIFGGAFQFPTDALRDDTPLLKSRIADNSIHHNRDHGIEIRNSFGLNIELNEIFSNGDDPATDRGIEINTDEEGGAKNFIPGNRNRISQNSIYDNVGQGIDLKGDTDGDGDGDHGIGCVILAGGFASPNDCIPAPVMLTQAVDKLVGTSCAGCLIEVFIADETPADQPPLGVPQRGEGRTFLRYEDDSKAVVEADSLGNWSLPLPCDLGEERLTATATDKTKNTSEFSANFLTLGTSACATPTFTPTATFTPAPPTATFTPAPPTATFTPVPPTSTPTPTKDCGDVNDDGSVNSIDAALILQLVAGLTPSLPNEPSADVNGDGAITSVDAALILQLDAGLITSLSC